MQAGSVNMRQQDQAGGVHQNVAFAAEGLLVGIKATLGTASAGGASCLSVDDGGRGLQVAALLLTGKFSKPVMQALESALSLPAQQLAVHRPKVGNAGAACARSSLTGPDRRWLPPSAAVATSAVFLAWLGAAATVPALPVLLHSDLLDKAGPGARTRQLSCRDPLDQQLR